MDAGILTHINAGQIETKGFDGFQKLIKLSLDQGNGLVILKRGLDGEQVFLKFLNIGIAGLSLFILNQILFGIVELHLDIVESTAVGFSLPINGIVLRQTGHGFYLWADIDNGR